MQRLGDMNTYLCKYHLIVSPPSSEKSASVLVELRKKHEKHIVIFIISTLGVTFDGRRS